MPKTATKPSGFATVELRISLGVPLGTCESLEDAIEKAKSIKVDDLVDFKKMDHNDSKMIVSGVYMIDVDPKL